MIKSQLNIVYLFIFRYINYDTFFKNKTNIIEIILISQEGGSLPEILQMVLIPKINDEDCAEAYKPYYTITPRMLCAGIPMGGKDACQVRDHCLL